MLVKPHVSCLRFHDLRFFFLSSVPLPCSNIGTKKGRLRPTIQCKQKHFSISESFQLCLDALLILFYVCSLLFFYLESEVGYLSWTERLFVFLGIEVLCNKIYHFKRENYFVLSLYRKKFLEMGDMGKDLF